MEIGKTRRTYTIEPVEAPPERERPPASEEELRPSPPGKKPEQAPAEETPATSVPLLIT
jgi:hypothetical protein